MSLPLPTVIERRLQATQSISLSDLQQTAALRTRVERKYVVDWATLAIVLDALGDTHRTLEIDGQRTHHYQSTYFDSLDLSAYRAHVQQRRRRYKVRTRHYVDSGLQLFEIKLKGRRGETIKHQLPYTGQDLRTLTDHAHQFLRSTIGEAYPRMPLPDLAPILSNRYERLTLATGNERLTCDFDVRYSDACGEVPGLDPAFVILESKCERGLGAADRELRRVGVKPVSCSKYCVGVGLLRADIKVNDLRWLMRRYFTGDASPGLDRFADARIVNA